VEKMKEIDRKPKNEKPTEQIPYYKELSNGTVQTSVVSSEVFYHSCFLCVSTLKNNTK
jgi:hypothetical protein